MYTDNKVSVATQQVNNTLSNIDTNLLDAEEKLKQAKSLVKSDPDASTAVLYLSGLNSLLQDVEKNFLEAQNGIEHLLESDGFIVAMGFDPNAYIEVQAKKTKQDLLSQTTPILKTEDLDLLNEKIEETTGKKADRIEKGKIEMQRLYVQAAEFSLDIKKIRHVWAKSTAESTLAYLNKLRKDIEDYHTTFIYKICKKINYKTKRERRLEWQLGNKLETYNKLLEEAKLKTEETEKTPREAFAFAAIPKNGVVQLDFSDIKLNGNWLVEYFFLLWKELGKNKQNIHGYDLNFSRCSITYSGLTILADLIKLDRTINLRKIDLSGIEITSEGLKILSDALKSNSTITDFKLDVKEINDKNQPYFKEFITQIIINRYNAKKEKATETSFDSLLSDLSETQKSQAREIFQDGLTGVHEAAKAKLLKLNAEKQTSTWKKGVRPAYF